ncbi:LysR family transcriptional regulator [Mycobacterium sp. 852013-50091_SCH5140682]|uniref:LysR family transcriptional regulator n=1 Tax=Mycobacterium sp. 852013-50091_SCH5140682 TaxID=1834109 RepID=UPI0007EA4DDC|nr:LysR family transcriptional regulator [Mycobacterium sp. 852013-50091_SCH5140682]OBC10832.1 LysR family transcriptional regulator [Mycobacterium sp. 852013-50091_SCH5140682]
MLGADNLQYFLEVARTGRLNEAARVLEVDQTTVGRRIAALERATGERLFDRTANGWRLTEAGERLLPKAQAVESAVVAAYDIQDTAAQALTGSVRIVTTDGFGPFVVAPHLVELAEAQPLLGVELVTATSRNAVAERHFDVAVILERPTSRAVRSEPLASFQMRLYASAEYLAKYPPIDTLADLGRHTVIWFVNVLLDVEPLRIFDALPDAEQSHAQISSVTGHWLAARSGLGIAVLPGYIGEDDPALVQVLPEAFDLELQYWLVIPRELEKLERVRTVRDFLQRTVHNHAHLSAALR